MWSSLLVPLPADAQAHPASARTGAESASSPAAAGLAPAAPDMSPVRAAGWRRWLPDWPQRARAALRR